VWLQKELEDTKDHLFTHKSPECVDLCGIDIVRSLRASHRVPSPRTRELPHALSPVV